jgi:CRP-like cAMP-binding protein
VALAQDIALLQQVPLFARLEREALRLIAFSAEARVYRAGDVIFRKGDRSDGAYLVTGGAVALDASDDGAPVEHVARTGTLIGEHAMIVETVRPATAIAREPTNALKIPRRIFRRVLEEHPESAEVLRQDIAGRLVGLSQRLEGVRASLLAVDAGEAPLTDRE